MKDSEKFYNATMNKKTSALIQRFFLNKYNEKLPGNTAIDLGCGAGNDTMFLLEKGFKVIAIDQEEKVKDIIENKKYVGKQLIHKLVPFIFLWEYDKILKVNKSKHY